jgi:hypothetical protein
LWLLGNLGAPVVRTKELGALSKQFNPDLPQEKIFIAVVRSPTISLFKVLRRSTTVPIDADGSPTHERIDARIACAAPAQDCQKSDGEEAAHSAIRPRTPVSDGVRLDLGMR